MFRGRLQTAKVLQKTMEIKKIIRVSEFKQEFRVLSSISRRAMYKLTICNVPIFACPDLKKGMFVSCTHIIFVFLFVIKIVDETVSYTLHISDKE